MENIESLNNNLTNVVSESALEVGGKASKKTAEKLAIA